MILQVCDVIPAGTGKAIINLHKLIITHFCIKHQYGCVLIATIFKIQILALLDVQLMCWLFKRHTYDIL